MIIHVLLPKNNYKGVGVNLKAMLRRIAPMLVLVGIAFGIVSLASMSVGFAMLAATLFVAGVLIFVLHPHKITNSFDEQ